MIETYDYALFVIYHLEQTKYAFLNHTIAHRNKLIFYSNDCAFCVHIIFTQIIMQIAMQRLTL